MSTSAEIISSRENVCPYYDDMRKIMCSFSNFMDYDDMRKIMCSFSNFMGYDDMRKIMCSFSKFRGFEIDLS